MIIQHDKMQLFLTVFMVNRTNQHAAGVNAHHGSGGQVGDGEKRLPNQLFGLIIRMNPAQNRPICARSIVQRKL